MTTSLSVKPDEIRRLEADAHLFDLVARTEQDPDKAARWEARADRLRDQAAGRRPLGTYICANQTAWADVDLHHTATRVAQCQLCYRHADAGYWCTTCDHEADTAMVGHGHGQCVGGAR